MIFSFSLLSPQLVSMLTSLPLSKPSNLHILLHVYHQMHSHRAAQSYCLVSLGLYFLMSNSYKPLFFCPAYCLALSSSLPSHLSMPLFTCPSSSSYVYSSIPPHPRMPTLLPILHYKNTCYALGTMLGKDGVKGTASTMVLLFIWWTVHNRQTEASGPEFPLMLSNALK